MDVIRTRSDGKLVEMFDTEQSDFIAGRLRMHKQTACRFTACQQEWYLSDRKQAFHDRRMKEDSGWKMPTSCPKCRDLSKIESIMSNNPEKCPATAKQIFNTFDSALAFAIVSAKANNGSPQHPYPCNECHGFHLSSMPPEEYDEIQRKKTTPPFRPAGSSGVIPPQNAQPNLEAQICDMYRKGARATEIAATLGMVYHKVRSILHKNGIKMRYKKAPLPVRPPTPADPEDLDAAMDQLRQKIAAFERQKQLIEEARRLRVERISPTAFRIAKEGESAILPMTELQPLITQLMTLYQEYSKANPRIDDEQQDDNAEIPVQVPMQ